MNTFLKWTIITGAVAAGAPLAYRAVRGMRRGIDRGLERVEELGQSADRVLASAQEAVGETRHAVENLRTSIS